MLKNEKDFYSGLLFIVVGAAFAIGSHGYSFGRPEDPGPAFLPFAAGIILAILGLIIVLNSLHGKIIAEGTLRLGNLKPLLWVTLANILFGACIGGLNWDNHRWMEPLGMIPGIFVLVLVSSLAEPAFKKAHAVYLAIGLSALSYAVFIQILGLVIPVWPTLLGWH